VVGESYGTLLEVHKYGGDDNRVLTG
jgi:hypothetical protein